MRLIVEAGTDVAAVAVGDPTLVGELRDARDMEQFEAGRSRARALGAFWRTDTGSDGAYLFHVFVDEDPPSELRACLSDAQTIQSFVLVLKRRE